MARKPRIHFPGAFYHVIVRGNNRKKLFFSLEDRGFFCRLVGEGVERFDHQIHAYCLMDNHAHFVVQVKTAPLSTIVHNLTFRYARAINRKLGRTGHLFERRYRAGLIDTDVALQAVLRYVHRNPLEAGLVRECADYRWSSHRAYLGGPRPRWLTTRLILGLFAGNPHGARRALASFVEDACAPFDDDGWSPEHPPSDVFAGPTPSPTSDYRRGEVTIEDVLEAVCKILGIQPREMRGRTQERRVSRARLLAAVITQELPLLSLRSLGDALGRDASTMSHAACRGTQRVRTEPDLRDQLDRARELLRRPRSSNH
jgi:REP element-mobilizing transposase RayT